MKILAIMRPAPGADVRTAIKEHAIDECRTLWELYRQDLVREYYSPGGPGIVMVIEAPSVQSAREKLGDLPLLSHRVMELELIELNPFSALQTLFAQADLSLA